MTRSQACLQVLLAGALLLAPAEALAQATESNDEPRGDQTGANVATVNEPVDYVMPDFKLRKPQPAAEDLPFFYIRPGLSLLFDYTAFDQDAVNVAQIGEQKDDWQIRSMRVLLNGSIGGDYRVSYNFAAEYKGFASDPENNWNITDTSLTFPIGDRTKLTVGKTKETFSYEMVGDAANLPHSERVLSPFFVSRNMGIKLLHVIGADKRATFSFGVFNEGWDIQSTGDPGLDFTARLTGLVWDVPDRDEFLHIGLGYRHAASNGTMRYKGRAETNLGDNWIDTGNFDGNGGDHFGGEALLNIGPFSLLGEYVTANVDVPNAPDSNFSGWYITGSWVLTGETRPYDRNVGYARRVIPKGRWGAPELVARYSTVDLNDKTLAGGKFDRLMLGINWWATTRWKLGLSYGHTWLDRSGVEGEANSLLTRIQWVY